MTAEQFDTLNAVVKGGVEVIHELKTLDVYWDAVARGDKTFEVRLNDRAFQTGDQVVLVKIDPKGGYVKPVGGSFFERCELQKRITYILQGGQFGIEPRYCILGLGDQTNDR